ncbi:MAG: FkbM family methyltransferase [Anaerolineae bacterium]|nr:FkbM family methyltransferase [Anaerolineae bacterium]
MKCSRNIHVSPLAATVRRLVGGLQRIRGVPRLLYWTRHWILPTNHVLITTPDGLPLTIDTDDYGQLMLFYFPYSLDERALLNDLLQQGDVCLDLGANVGVLAIEMARIVGETGLIIAVDANPRVVWALNNTIELCAIHCLHAVHSGIAGYSGVGQLIRPAVGFSESVEVSESLNDGDYVPLTTIDELVKIYLDGRTPDLIKVDIEGSEVDLIASMSNIFSTGIFPMLLVEFHRDKCVRRGGDVEQIREYLATSGYSERRLRPNRGTYNLIYDSQPLSARENVLFVTSSHLSLRPKLRLKWQ